MSFEKPPKPSGEKEKKPDLAKREFLKNALTTAGVVASGLTLGNYIAKSAEESREGQEKERYASPTMDGVIVRAEIGRILGMTALPGFFGGTPMMTTQEVHLLYISDGSKEIKVAVDRDSFASYKTGDHVHIKYRVNPGNPHLSNHLEALSLEKN